MIPLLINVHGFYVGFLASYFRQSQAKTVYELKNTNTDVSVYIHVYDYFLSLWVLKAKFENYELMYFVSITLS